MPLPNRLLELRERDGLSRMQVAIKLGVDPSTIARWETQVVSIPDKRKVQLAGLFKVEIDDLVCWQPVETEAA